MTSKVLFVVAHPDDESLWIGGTLKFLSERNEVDPYVVLLFNEKLVGVIGWLSEDEPNVHSLPEQPIIKSLCGINHSIKSS